MKQSQLLLVDGGRRVCEWRSGIVVLGSTLMILGRVGLRASAQEKMAFVGLACIRVAGEFLSLLTDGTDG